MVTSQVLGHNLIVPQSDGEKDQWPLLSMLLPTVPVHLLWPLLISLVCLSIYLLWVLQKALWSTPICWMWTQSSLRLWWRFLSKSTNKSPATLTPQGSRDLPVWELYPTSLPPLQKLGTVELPRDPLFCLSYSQCHSLGFDGSLEQTIELYKH